MDSAALESLVRELLEALGLPADGIAVSSGPRTVVSVTSAESKELIGPNGEHLAAINMLARKLAERRLLEQKGGTDESAAASFLIDINGYHESRLDALRESARLLAQRARLFKHEVEMSPMTSYERLIIHELFAGDPEIRTESAGEGKTRHVVLKYKGQEPEETNNF